LIIYYLFPTGNLGYENTQRCYEISPVLLSTCTVATAVKLMWKHCGRCSDVIRILAQIYFNYMIMSYFNFLVWVLFLLSSYNYDFDRERNRTYMSLQEHVFLFVWDKKKPLLLDSITLY
jgi:hypothetical protein